MKFTITKSCLARFSGIFALGTPSNIHGTAISYHCAKFGDFVNSETILILTDLTIGVTIDCGLNFNLHISNVCKKASQRIGVIMRLRNLIPTEAKLHLFKAAILPHLTYCHLVPQLRTENTQFDT